MENKNIFILLIIMVVALGVYFLFSSEQADAPAMDQTETTDEVVADPTDTESNDSPTTDAETPTPAPIVVTPAAPTAQPTIPVNNDDIIGMTTTAAQAFAQANGVSFRIGTINGEPLAVTMDYVPGRITAEIQDGTVVAYTTE